MENNKKKKIVIGILLLVLALAMAIIIFVINKPDKEYEDKYLEEMNFTKTLENVSSIYVDNDVETIDENQRKLNNSAIISNEKFILDNKVGMYDFSILSDLDESKLTFTVKNHNKEKIEGFNYRLQFVNNDGSIAGTIDLESKEIPALSKYKVTVNIDSDITNTFDIIPVTDFQTYGYIGGGYLENK